MSDPRCPRCQNERDDDVVMYFDEDDDMWVCPECGCQIDCDDPFLATCE